MSLIILDTVLQRDLVDAQKAVPVVERHPASPRTGLSGLGLAARGDRNSQSYVKLQRT